VLFASISRVGALLLHLGDMGQKLREETKDGSATCRQEDATYGMQDVSCGKNYATCGQEDATCGQEESTCGQKDATCGQEDATFGQKDATCGQEDATCGQGGGAVKEAAAVLETELTNPPDELRVIGDWYCDDGESAKQSSAANRSLNRLIEGGPGSGGCRIGKMDSRNAQ
jgi:hypothetical protein